MKLILNLNFSSPLFNKLNSFEQIIFIYKMNSKNKKKTRTKLLKTCLETSGTSGKKQKLYIYYGQKINKKRALNIICNLPRTTNLREIYNLNLKLVLKKQKILIYYYFLWRLRVFDILIFKVFSYTYNCGVCEEISFGETASVLSFTRSYQRVCVCV